MPKSSECRRGENPYFSNNVKTLRKRYNYTLDSLSTAIGISATALRDMERGQVTSPRFLHVARMARLFDRKLDKVTDEELAINFIKHNFKKDDWKFLFHYVEVRRQAQVESGRFKNLLLR